MISNKDLRVEGSNLIINGEKHPLDPAVDALIKRANTVQGKLSALDAKLDAIEALEKTASGNPISLTGVAAAYAMDLSMTIEPIQSGSGDPSPTNVRPISGLTSGEVTATNGTDTNTATITFGQTVYGGSVNFKTGEVTVTHGAKTYDGITQTNWSVVQYTNLCAFIPLSEVGTGHRTFILSNIFKSYEIITNKPNGTNGISIEGISSGLDGVFVGIGDLAIDKNSWLLYLQEHPLTICYELATPTTLTLTPAELELLKGNNTITANGANINLSYIGR